MGRRVLCYRNLIYFRNKRAGLQIRRGLQLRRIRVIAAVHYPSRCDESNVVVASVKRGTDSPLPVLMDRGRQIVVTLRGLTALRLSNIFRHVNPRSREDTALYVYTYRDFCIYKRNSGLPKPSSLSICITTSLRPVKIRNSLTFKNQFNLYIYI